MRVGFQKPGTRGRCGGARPWRRIPTRSAKLLSAVSQSSTLPRLGKPPVPTASRRYSRVKLCATLKTCACRPGFRAPSVPASPMPQNVVRAFTLIELILVMAIVVIAISITAPRMANFFRGRTLDSEARRLLALTHSGQSRAISEGIPTRLQFDIPNHSYELLQDPGWSDRDPKALKFAFDQD